jgi:hypothetical protein
VNEIEQHHKDIAMWEAQADLLRQNVMAVQLEADQKWAELEALEKKISQAFQQVLEMET